MSARPLPRRSARKRGCLSTRHPPASCPKSASTTCGGRNVPSPFPGAVHTPVSPNPTMSARSSPVMSARKRGLRSTRKRQESGATASAGTHEPPIAPGHAELAGVGLRPFDLRPVVAAVLGHPEAARQRARENEFSVVRARERKHAPGREVERRIERHVRQRRTDILDDCHGASYVAPLELTQATRGAYPRSTLGLPIATLTECSVPPQMRAGCEFSVPRGASANASALALPRARHAR